MKRLSRLLTAALAAGVIALLGLGPANAAIVTTITDGDETITLTDPGNTLTATYTLDGYTGNIQVVNTNFPGSPAQGTLTTTTTINQVLANPDDTPPITVHSGVYTDVTGTTLANFTLPNSFIYNLKNDVTGNGTPLNGAMISGTSTSNGVTTAPGVVTVGSTNEVVTNSPFLGQPVTNFYTLENTSVISGIVVGDSGLSLAVASVVTAVAPEPSTLGAALIALPVIGFVISRRKRSARV